MNIDEMKKKSIDGLKKLTNYEDLIQIDKKILFSVGFFLLVLTICYYYYLFAIYPKHNIVKSNPSKASTISFNLPMKSSYILANSSSSTIDLKKIPAKYMNVSNIPKSDGEMYIKVFDILYDYFDQVNKGNFNNVQNFLDKDFVDKNHISVADLKDKFGQYYYRQSSFYIQNVTKNGNSYGVNVLIYNTSTDVGGFEDGLTIVTDKNNKFKIIHQMLVR